MHTCVEENNSNRYYSVEEQASESDNKWDWLSSLDSDIDFDSDFEMETINSKIIFHYFLIYSFAIYFRVFLPPDTQKGYITVKNVIARQL